MLHFLKSIFESSSNSDDLLSEDMLKAAIEKAVDKTDHRLRALSNYSKRLHDPVARALRHIIELLNQLSEPVEISPSNYGHDPRLRAMFASAEHMNDVFRRFQTVREYLEHRPGLPPDNIYGLLSVAKKEKRILGMELEGDLLRRDVLQTAITFEDHQYLAPADSKESARTELTALAFDFLLQNALEKIAAQRLRRGELTRTRQILRRKLLSSKVDPSEVASLETNIAIIDEELGGFGGIELSLGESLRHVEAVLNEADQWLAVAPFRVNLDYRNVRSTSSETLEMSEVSSLSGLRRIVLFGYIPRRQWPEPKNLLKLGQAYLG